MWFTVQKTQCPKDLGAVWSGLLCSTISWPTATAGVGVAARRLCSLSQKAENWGARLSTFIKTLSKEGKRSHKLPCKGTCPVTLRTSCRALPQRVHFLHILPLWGQSLQSPCTHGGHTNHFQITAILPGPSLGFITLAHIMLQKQQGFLILYLCSDCYSLA